jgi:regulator of replication initiation timing
MSNSDEVKKLKKQIEKLEAECADVVANKEKIQKQNEIFAKELNKLKKEGVKETPSLLDKKKEEKEKGTEETPPAASEVKPIASNSSPAKEVDSVAIIKLKKAEKELEEIKKLADSLKEENKSLKTKNASTSNAENSQNKEPALKAKEVPVLAPALMGPISSPVKGENFQDILKDMMRLFSDRNDLAGGLRLQPSIFLRLLKTYAKESENDVIINLEDLSSCLLSFMIKITTEQLDVHIQIIYNYLFTI